MADIQDRNKTRERLRREKPIVYDKFIQLDKKLEKGESPAPVIEIAYRYDCNLRCKHCFADRFRFEKKNKKKVSLDDLKKLSQQANELEVYQFILQGGEPIFWRDFDDVVKALNPKEFYLGLVTNATLLNKEKIMHLREVGIDKIVMSLDSYDAVQYEEIRNRVGLFEHTIKMILLAKEVGLRVVVNTLAIKQNVRSPKLLQLIELAKKHDFIIYVNFAAPIGNWEGRYDLLLDKDDAAYIYDLNKRHEIVKRDIFPYKGINVGCPAFRSIIYITETGDVLPCPFIHISVGNILRESLSKIIENGMRIKWFKNRPAVCLACEDTGFIKNVIAKTYGKPSPVDMNEIFTKDDLC